MPMRNMHNHQRGVSLIELMVGTTVSLILLTGVVTVMMRITVAGGESIQATRLNQQLRGTLSSMSKDLQRAGYVNWFDAWDASDVNAGDDSLDDSNGDGDINILDFYQTSIPVINSFGAVSLFDVNSGAACTTNCDCILFSYDLDDNGGLSTGLFELFGFRLNAGAVEMRTGGSPNSCTAGTWQDMTDSNVTITNLSFSMAYAGAIGVGNDSTVYSIVDGSSAGLGTDCVPGAGGIDDDKCLWRRKVRINLQGQLAADATVTTQLTTDVKIKNDYFNTAP